MQTVRLGALGGETRVPFPAAERRLRPAIKQLASVAVSMSAVELRPSPRGACLLGAAVPAKTQGARSCGCARNRAHRAASGGESASIRPPAAVFVLIYE